MHLTPGQNTIGNLNSVGDIRNNLEDVGARASYFFTLHEIDVEVSFVNSGPKFFVFIFVYKVDK